MADMVTSLLLSACIGTSGSYNAACQKALESTYVQSGYSAKVSQVQSGLTSYGKSKERDVFGHSVWLVDGVVAGAIIARDKKANLVLPNLGICDIFSTQLQPNKYGLKWEWHW